MLNLAPLRYAGVLLKDHGPIERIEYGRVKMSGKTVYQANAYLSRHLNLARPRMQVFGQADGSGTHSAAIVARHMAISEAIERWALYFLNQSGLKKGHGLELDDTSTGMAAFPGLLRVQARRRALMEAAERYCLVAWWEGLLRSRSIELDRKAGLEAIEIENPLTSHKVVVLWKKAGQAYAAFVYSAGRTLKKAVVRAEIELERCAGAISHHYQANPGFELDDLDTIANLMERRVLYFSLPEGYREFRARADAPAKAHQQGDLEAVVDMEIKGPWSRYATVWRVLYPMPTRNYLGPHTNVFYW